MYFTKEQRNIRGNTPALILSLSCSQFNHKEEKQHIKIYICSFVCRRVHNINSHVYFENPTSFNFQDVKVLVTEFLPSGIMCSHCFGKKARPNCCQITALRGIYSGKAFKRAVEYHLINALAIMMMKFESLPEDVLPSELQS